MSQLQNKCILCHRKKSKFGYCAKCLSTMCPQYRVMVYSEVMPSGCWEWQGITRGAIKGIGYGALTVKNKLTVAHRYSYEAFKGKIPEGMFVLHKCDNKPCVNPDHLELGTAKKNTEDAYERGLIPKGEKYWSAKLTDKQRDEMHTLLDEGHQQIDVAKKYGISQPSVSESYNKHKSTLNGERVEIAIEEK